VAPPPLFPLRGHRPASTDTAQSGHVGRGTDHLMSPFWVWTQGLIVFFVLAGIVIALVKIL
jgi:hypothetical protein